MPQAVADGTGVNKSVVRLVKDDITVLDVNAFVLYAQHDLALGSGFGTAISVRGGPKVQEELSAMEPLSTGEVAVSGAGNLKAEYIIHAVGPRFQEDGMEAKLRMTVARCLQAAEEKSLEKIAFPAMGVGYYGVDPAVSARVMTEEIAKHLSGDTCVKEVMICVYDSPQYNSFKGPVAAMGS